MIKTLRIQLTDECNLNCVYCCHEGTKSDYSILKNRNLQAFIRASYDVLKIKRVKFTGGEPLEYDESIYGIINSVNRPEIHYSIVTNGTNYGAFKGLIDAVSNMEATISLPIPPNIRYSQSYKSITGAIDEKKSLSNVISCIEYMLQSKVSFKINYVLCNNKNTSKEYINEMITYAQQHPSIQLRFLETAVNSTNNQNGRMSRLVFSQTNFEQILKDLGYEKSVLNKFCDRRSSCLYDIDGCIVKFIKFFCENDCDECPEDKTSLWLTSTGCVKQCSYRSSSARIDNWQYNRIANQLQELFL